MNEISNRTLTFLVIFAVLLSIGSTLINLNRISKLGIPVSGMASQGFSYANVTVQSLTELTVSESIVFGEGYVNSSSSNRAILKGNSSTHKPDNGGGTWDWGERQAINLKNTGNQDLVFVNVSSNASKDDFIGGPNPLFEIAVVDNENGACTGEVQNTWIEINTTNVSICGSGAGLLQTGSSNNEMNVSIKLGIPEEVSTGKTGRARLTFTAESN